MDWSERMNDVVEYIENHLNSDIDYNVCGKILCCSSYEFSRIFSFVAGMPVSEYIRCRRMSNAALDIQNSEAKIIDIALKHGYESHAAVTRAFKEIYGYNPLAARGDHETLKIYPKIFLKIKEVNPMTPQIIQKDQIFLSGFLVKNDGGNIWRRYEKDTEIFEQPELVDWSAYEVRFNTKDGELIFTACRQKERITSPHYDLMVLPSSIWAVFEIDCKVDQSSQYNGVDVWLDENKDIYKQSEWDANGK